KVKTTKRRYQISVAVRRLIAEEFHNGVVFTISPDEWPVPEKPRPTHFQPLSSEQIVKLEEFLREEIDVAYKKDEIFQSARKSGVVSNKIGIDFWYRPNPDPELPRFTDWHESQKMPLLQYILFIQIFQIMHQMKIWQKMENFIFPKTLHIQILQQHLKPSQREWSCKTFLGTLHLY
ncbi:hypothetical protein DMW30_25035, partial [Vibrio parahaemolyticus]|nr:hypothetical protein [Vibrio parahaemolyticus]